MIGNENGPLERMSNARQVLKTTLDFGRVVAEVDFTHVSRVTRLRRRLFVVASNRQISCWVVYEGLGGMHIGLS